MPASVAFVDNKADLISEKSHTSVAFVDKNTWMNLVEFAAVMLL